MVCLTVLCCTFTAVWNRACTRTQKSRNIRANVQWLTLNDSVIHPIFLGFLPTYFMKTFKFKMPQVNLRSRGASGWQEEKKSRVRRDKNSFLFQTTLKKQKGYMLSAICASGKKKYTSPTSCNLKTHTEGTNPTCCKTHIFVPLMFL